MAYGKFVFTTVIGDVSFLMENGVNDIVTLMCKADLLAESIIYLAENPELRNLIGNANVKKMAGYDWDKIAKQYYTLYPEILNG